MRHVSRPEPIKPDRLSKTPEGRPSGRASTKTKSPKRRKKKDKR